jgi:hypothetical protein
MKRHVRGTVVYGKTKFEIILNDVELIIGLNWLRAGFNRLF